MDAELSISERILRVVRCRLGEVLKANGYRTDAGLRVFHARSSVSPEELPCFNVRGERTTAANAAGNNRSMAMTKTITVEFITAANQEATGEMLERGLADAKKALLLFAGGISDSEGSICGALSYDGDEAAPRKDGDTTESVLMTFTATYQEGYGNPYATR